MNQIALSPGLAFFDDTVETINGKNPQPLILPEIAERIRGIVFAASPTAPLEAFDRHHRHYSHLWKITGEQQADKEEQSRVNRTWEALLVILDWMVRYHVEGLKDDRRFHLVDNRWVLIEGNR